jgi:hypothetical protein
VHMCRMLSLFGIPIIIFVDPSKTSKSDDIVMSSKFYLSSLTQLTINHGIDIIGEANKTIMVIKSPLM